MFSKFSNISGPISSFSHGYPSKLLISLDSLYYNLYNTEYTVNPDNSGVTYSSNSITSTNAGGGWTSHIYSNETYSGPVKLKFQTSDNTYIICGFSEDPTANVQPYDRLKSSFFTNGNNNVKVREGPYDMYSIDGLYTSSTIYTIIYDGTEVKYFIDDVLIYVSRSTPNNPLYFYATFLTTGFSLTNIEFGDNTNIRWNDLTINHNNFDLQKSPIYKNSSLYFNSLEGQYATGNDLGDLNKFTVDAWFNLKSLPVGLSMPQIVTNVFSEFGPYVNFAIGFLKNYDNDLKIYGGFFANWSWVFTDGFTPDLNTWYNCTLTYDGKNLNFYLNGNIISSTNYGIKAISSGLGINIAKRWDNDEFIDGNIDIIKIWDNPLDSNKISYNYENTKNRFIINEGSLLLDGSTWLEVDASNDWILSNIYTIEFWSNADIPSTGGKILTVISQYPNDSIDIFYQDGKLVIENDKILCAEPTPEIWTHVAIVCNKGLLTVYYNGVIQGSNSGKSLGGNLGIAIGRRGTSVNFQYFYGKIYGLKISNTSVYNTTFDPYIALPPIVDNNTMLLITQYQPSINTFLDTTDRHVLYNGGASYSANIPILASRYFKLTVTKIKDNTNHVTQMADLILQFEGSPISWNISASASNPDGICPPGEEPWKLLDNQPGTKWCNTNFFANGGIATVYIDNITPISFDSYYYVTGNDVPERDPISWILETSNDNSTWSIVDIQTDVLITDSRKADTQVFTIQ